MRQLTRGATRNTDARDGRTNPRTGTPPTLDQPLPGVAPGQQRGRKHQAERAHRPRPAQQPPPPTQMRGAAIASLSDQPSSPAHATRTASEEQPLARTTRDSMEPAARRSPTRHCDCSCPPVVVTVSPRGKPPGAARAWGCDSDGPAGCWGSWRASARCVSPCASLHSPRLALSPTSFASSRPSSRLSASLVLLRSPPLRLHPVCPSLTVPKAHLMLRSASHHTVSPVVTS
jgi:hypothetical protein